MSKKQKTIRQGPFIPTVLLSVALVLLGLLLLFVSELIGNNGALTYIRAFVKDLGIVILAVTTVHLLYHLVLAKGYQEEFMAILRTEVAAGESNAAVCAAMGIMKIYANRTAFAQEHPLQGS